METLQFDQKRLNEKGAQSVGALLIQETSRMGEKEHFFVNITP